MRVLVFSRKDVQIARTYGTHAFISINDSDQTPAPLPPSFDCVGILRLSFDDVLDGSPQGREIVAFDDEMAEQILDFVELCAPQIDALVIHCNGGQCRSPGVAAAIEKIYTGDDSAWFGRKRPNMLVYRRLLEVDFLRRNPD